MELVAHSGGMGWDEAWIFAVPVIILVALQVLARRKVQEADDERDEGDAG